MNEETIDGIEQDLNSVSKSLQQMIQDITYIEGSEGLQQSLGACMDEIDEILKEYEKNS